MKAISTEIRRHVRMKAYAVWHMKKTREILKPTESELELLSILWQRRETTVRELSERFLAGSLHCAHWS